MSDFKRHLPSDNGVHSMHVALNRIWDAIEANGGTSGGTTVYVTSGGGGYSAPPTVIVPTGTSTTPTPTTDWLTVLGYTPVNKAGDIDVGSISMQGLTATTGSFSGQVTTTDLYSSGNVSAYSDARLKTNVVTMCGALDKVLNLRSVNFSWADPAMPEAQIGLIAQEVRAVVPEVVSEHEGTLAVDYGKLVAVLIGAVQEQQKQIDRLLAERCAHLPQILDEC